MALGGEQRFGRYRLLEHGPALNDNAGANAYLALSPVSVETDSRKVLLGTTRIIYRGGWDMANQFHKPMQGYYPPGSVFSRNINDVCIAL